MKKITNILLILTLILSTSIISKGQEWELVLETEGEVVLTSIAAADSLNIWSVGFQGPVPNNPFIIRTEDGGQTWEESSFRGRGFALDASGEFFYVLWGNLISKFHLDTNQLEDYPLSYAYLDLEDIAAHPYKEGLVYIVYHQQEAPYVNYSSDSGNSWTAVEGMEHTAGGRLYFDTQGSEIVYLIGNYKNARSEDNGKTWEICPISYTISSSSSSRALIDPEDVNHLYMTTRGYGVLVSEDGCQSWESNNQGLENLFVNTLAIDFENPDTIYAGTDSGIYISYDGGESWGVANEGLLGGLVIYSIVVDPSDTSNVYAATPLGIFKLEGNQ